MWVTAAGASEAGFEVETQTFSVALSNVNYNGVGSVQVKEGYTLWKNMFVTIFSADLHARSIAISQNNNLVTVSIHMENGKGVPTSAGGTIYYIGTPSVSYNVYAISITGNFNKVDETWTDDGGEHARIHVDVSGTIYLKVEGTTVSVYNNTCVMNANSHNGGSLSQITVQPTLSNISMTDQQNGTLTMAVAASGSKDNTKASVSGSVGCTISNTSMTITNNVKVNGSGWANITLAESTPTVAVTKTI